MNTISHKEMMIVRLFGQKRKMIVTHATATVYFYLGHTYVYEITMTKLYKDNKCN